MDLLDFQKTEHTPGDRVVHIWTGEEYVIFSKLGKNVLGYPAYYAYKRSDPNQILGTIDSTEVAKKGDKIIKILKHWRTQLLNSGKKNIVVGQEQGQDKVLQAKLVCWFIETEQEYKNLVLAKRDTVKFLYYWTLA